MSEVCVSEVYVCVSVGELCVSELCVVRCVCVCVSELCVSECVCV